MSEGERARVVVIDDHATFAESLGVAISLTKDLECVGHAGGVDAAIELVRRARPDCLILDYRLLDGTGIECARVLREEGVDAAMIVLTAFPTPNVHRLAERVAIDLVLSKDTSVPELISHIRQALGRGAASRAPRRRIAPEIALSEREIDVLELMGEGLRAEAIAERLNLSIHTVRDHIKQILSKLDSSSQLEAVSKAMRLGLLAPPV